MIKKRNLSIAIQDEFPKETDRERCDGVDDVGP
jgi:hypothetical protein